MPRKKVHHDDHVNHEAWVIPYADLLTLLLAFFVVMYALSSLNEGKYKILAASLASAFGGPPRSVTPIQMGESQVRGSDHDRPSPRSAGTPASPTVQPNVVKALDRPDLLKTRVHASGYARENQAKEQLRLLNDRIRNALEQLVEQKLVTIRHTPDYIEVQIQSDILFASGDARPSSVARDTTQRIGRLLSGEPNAIRVEGYTDNLPISNHQFASNWELSSARAASIVHELAKSGVRPANLAIAAYGEHQPFADNATPEGRNANRRVMLVILSHAGTGIAPRGNSAPSGSHDKPAAGTPATTQVTADNNGADAVTAG